MAVWSTASALAAFCSLLAFASPSGIMMECKQPASDKTTIYDFSFMDIMKERMINLSDYKGKTVLIVNVATFCGLTPHYYGMNALNSKYGVNNNSDFAVLGFPSNVFNKQEPGANGTEILHGVKYVRPGNSFVPNFQLFEKGDVNGNNEHKLYTYLKKYCPPTTSTFNPSILFYTPIKSSDVQWNWETFLIDRNGHVIKRAPPAVPPESLANDIEAAMAKAAFDDITVG